MAKVMVGKKDVAAVTVGPGGTKIAAAAGVAVKKRSGLSKAIEAAMQKAILDAAEEGIGADQTEEIKARMMAAREAVIAEFEAAQAPAANEQ